ASRTTLNGAAHANPGASAAAEAISALVNLGYQPQHAAAAIATASGELGEEAETATLIRRGLKELARPL
ncbi:MAG: hypothetical protein AB7L90_13890, partial [Hyphomicrobiaceae bacterium]